LLNESDTLVITGDDSRMRVIERIEKAVAQDIAEYESLLNAV
jgi:hypothetical protein